jgi:hypothetical protein
MSDKIVGIAVLDRTRDALHETEWLHVCCTYKNGQLVHSAVPVRPKGTPDKQYSWEYELKDDMIHVTPSLKISTTRPLGDENESVELFHSDGAWSVKYVEFFPVDYEQSYDMFRKLNPDAL